LLQLNTNLAINGLRNLLLLGALVLSSGCATVANQTEHSALKGGHNSGASRDYIEGQLAKDLDNMTGDFTREYSATPFGAASRISAQPPYFSASGRHCRKLSITEVSSDSSVESPALVCRVQDGQWEVVRVLIR
jgi:hypothetical protein